MVGYSELINNSGFQWRTCMLTSDFTVNMLIYNVKRARLFVLLSTTFHFTFLCVLVASILIRLKGPNQRVQR